MKNMRLARVVVTCLDHSGNVLDNRDARVKDNSGKWITPKAVKKVMKKQNKDVKVRFKRRNYWTPVFVSEDVAY